MARKLFDLAGADEKFRFSPYCWRIRLALAHKALRYDTVPWRFTEKDVIAFSGQTKVPVLVDGKEVIADSYAIAEYLEARYPNGPSLFGGTTTTALTRFIKQWAEDTLHPTIVKLVLPSIFVQLHPKDQAYFRQSREAYLGMTIEALAARREEFVPAFKAALIPLRTTLRAQPFLAGDGPMFADHIVFGALQWARLASAVPLLELDDPIWAWMESLIDAYAIR